MVDFVANTQISVPLYDSRLKSDVDLNGLQFSYQYGMFYQPTSTYIPVKMPPPWPTS